MHVVVPFAASAPKTRLADVLSPAERDAFARAMLRNVLDAVRGAGGDPTVLSTDPLDGDDVGGAAVDVDDRPLSPAVNARLADAAGPVAVVMADLALATPAALTRLFETEGDVAVAPGRGGGTNALVVRHPDFRVDYHGVSYRDHLRAAEAVGARVETVDSMRLATDVDEPADLVEVLLHGEGAVRTWLEDAGFELVVDGEKGRVRLARR